MIITMKAQELREFFFEFFRSKGHTVVPSAPMVVRHDPTLMFTNAGMNQFKDVFLGNQQPAHKRIANSQKCLRVSGKHNDLEEVGHDTYHHTMFEMLGNWSFGDYFKKEAIEWSRELLIDRLGIPEERVYVTIFEGNPAENVPRDNEAFECWKKCFSNPENKIIDGSKKDNFWEMGETGPCGPCSEIHVDIRDDEERMRIPGHELVNKGDPRVIEIWNLVFIQYNRRSDGKLDLLPSRHVDTGMGFERLCMILQGKNSNYDTDLFQPIIRRISEITGRKYGVNDSWDVAMRVIADHLRAVSFSIADGQLPSNNKAGYVIRRILRRAVRYAYTSLGMEEPFIFRLVPLLSETMGGYYPELPASINQISRIIQEEETGFLKTLGRGLKIIEKTISDLKKEDRRIMPGKTAFELYDTFGFPVDLTRLILREQDMDIDTEEFEREMKGQKERSREDASLETGDWIVVRDIEGTQFTGYENTEDDVLITRYRKIRVKDREAWQIILDRTPFYAEAGGQAGDSGLLRSPRETIEIRETIKENNLIIHVADKMVSSPDDTFRAVVDSEKRLMTANNHTATHLIHHALREVLGKHVEQKGSLVTHERLRFDFSHFTKPTREELTKVEEMANRLVRENHSSRVTDGIPMEDAKAMGAISLFGEKYGEKVRVVGFGDSLELCGGTHVGNTGSIGIVKIISETAVASGIRRIEAVTAARAEEYINEKLTLLNETSSLLKSSGNIRESVEKLMAENNALKKSLEKYQSWMTKILVGRLEEKAVAVNDISFIADYIESESVDFLKNIAFRIRSSSDNSVLVLGSETGGKAHLMVMVCDRLVKERNISAVDIIKDIAVEIRGGGGGQPFLATAGGSEIKGIERALKRAEEFVRRL